MNTTSLERSARAQVRDAAAHDRAVSTYSAATATAAAADLDRKKYWNQKDPEHRWGMARRAALLRRLLGFQSQPRRLNP